MNTKQTRNRKEPTFAIALATLMLFVAIAAYFIIGLEAEPHIAMLTGCVIAGVAGALCGCTWEDIEKGMIAGMTQALGACIILLLIGVLIGVWISAGVVQAMIYYGLELLSPNTFLAGSMILCALVSMAMGSWGAAGTLGIALISIAQIMGFPLPIAAGAIISGSYIGDRISPISDMSNLTSSVTGVNIIDSVKAALPVNLGGAVIAAAAYWIIGLRYTGSASLGAQVGKLSGLLCEQFSIGFWDFLPLLVLLGCILLKIPAILSIIAGIFSGAVMAVAVQGQSLRAVVESCFFGYSSNSGESTIDALLTAGGIESMQYSLTLALSAMMFGGIMDQTGLMRAFMHPMVDRLRRQREMSAAVVIATFVVSVVLPDSYVAIALPGGMFREIYKERGFSLRKLSRSLGSGACSFSPLIPWSTCGIFMSTVLCVPTLQYMPYTFLNVLVPFGAIVIGCFSRKGSDAASA